MRYRFLRNTVIAGILVFGWSSGVSADPGGQPVTGLYVFGDSLSDSAGNLFALSGGFEPPSPPYADGRFSNGPLWVETLAGMLGLPIDAGNNRAVGGAFTDTRSTAPFAEGTGILGQVAKFRDDGILIEPTDLVIVWGGANNYLSDTSSIPALVVQDLRQAVEELAELGGRRFLIPNLPALGDTPLGNPDFEILDSRTKALLNLRTAQHNTVLAAELRGVAAALGVEIAIVNIQATFDGLLADPEPFGFFNASIPCLVQLADGTRVPTGACPPDGMGGFDAAGTVFWDLIHPTTAAHAIVAMVARSALGAIEAPALAQTGN